MGVNVIVIGPPGAGKGTQAARLAQERRLARISTGDILREAIRAETPFARAARARMDRGELVDDETMIAIVRERLQRPDAQVGFVLDGFPRTVEQARALDRVMAERDNGPLVVVDVVVPEEELVRRLAGRRICASCGGNADPAASARTCGGCGGALVQRADDTQDVVRDRLDVYARSTRPVLDYYRERPTFRTLHGAQAPDTVAREMNVAIEEAVAAGARTQVAGRDRAW